MVLSVAFEPHEMGVAQETLVLVCDNCQVGGWSSHDAGWSLGLTESMHACMMAPISAVEPLGEGPSCERHIIHQQ